MKRFLTTRLLFVAIVATAFEISIADRIALLGGRLEPLLILAVYAALFAARPSQGWATAWILGLAKDCGSALPLGFHALLFLALAWTLLLLRHVVFREHPLTQCAVVFGGVLAIDLVAALFVCVFVGGIPFWLLAGKALAGATMSAVLAPVLLWGLGRWKSFLRPA